MPIEMGVMSRWSLHPAPGPSSLHREWLPHVLLRSNASYLTPAQEMHGLQGVVILTLMGFSSFWGRVGAGVAGGEGVTPEEVPW